MRNIESDKEVIANYFGYSTFEEFKVREKSKNCKGTIGEAILNIMSELETLKEKSEHLESELNSLNERNKELSIIKSLIEAFEVNGIDDGCYIVMTKRGFLNSSYKKLLDDFIAKKKIENKVLELNKEISKMEIKYKNSFLKKKEKIREELVRLDERLKTYVELLEEE